MYEPQALESPPTREAIESAYNAWLRSEEDLSFMKSVKVTSSIVLVPLALNLVVGSATKLWLVGIAVQIVLYSALIMVHLSIMSRLRQGMARAWDEYAHGWANLELYKFTHPNVYVRNPACPDPTAAIYTQLYRRR